MSDRIISSMYNFEIYLYRMNTQSGKSANKTLKTKSLFN